MNTHTASKSFGPLVDPATLGFAPDRLARIRPALEREIAEGKIPGAVTMIARKGVLAYADAVGVRDPATGAPISLDTIFSIASMTKLMTSVAIMILYEEGRLLLSDPASKFLPQLAGMSVAKSLDGPLETVPVERDFTVQDLLRHTSGLTYKSRGTSEAHQRSLDGLNLSSLTREEFLEHTGKAPLLYQPGTTWEYGLSTDVLGLIVEAVAGQTLGEFLKERVWSPLGMIDTSFALPADKVGRYARAFDKDALTGAPVRILHAGKHEPIWESGGGGCVSTASDYMRFLQMLLNGGELDGVRVLGPKTVAYMTSDHLGSKIVNRITTMDPACEGYGFGLGVAVRLGTGVAGVNGTSGDWYWSGVFGTYYWVDPVEQMAVVFMAMAPGMVRLRYRALMRSLVLQALAS